MRRLLPVLLALPLHLPHICRLLHPFPFSLAIGRPHSCYDRLLTSPGFRVVVLVPRHVHFEGYLFATCSIEREIIITEHTFYLQVWLCGRRRWRESWSAHCWVFRWWFWVWVSCARRTSRTVSCPRCRPVRRTRGRIMLDFVIFNASITNVFYMQHFADDIPTKGFFYRRRLKLCQIRYTYRLVIRPFVSTNVY